MLRWLSFARSFHIGNRLGLRKSFCAALFISFALASSADACTACMGDGGSNVGEAANGAIFLMLGVLAVVFGLLGAFGIYLYRRALAPLPPHVELSEAGPEIS
jgi:hypothetical protein